MMTDGDGDNRGSPLDFEGFNTEGNECAASSDGRNGRVVAIFVARKNKQWEDKRYGVGLLLAEKWV